MIGNSEAIERAARIVSIFVDADRRRNDPPLQQVLQDGINRTMADWWSDADGRIRALEIMEHEAQR